ncbi:MAG: transporter permease [Rhizobium sp.]|nr:transporter permease [Rhizobium sp.]
MTIASVTDSSSQAAAPAEANARPVGSVGLRWLPRSLILPLMVIAFWELAVRVGLASGALMPPPSAVLKALWLLAQSGELFTHMWTTSLRVLSGFLFGAMAGTVFGAATGYFRPLRDLLDPSIQALRSIPSIAWVPLFILWLGIFEASKVTLIAVGVFFPVYLGVSAGIISVDRRLVEVGRIFNLSGLQLVRRILLPSMIPGYVVALRNGLGLGWMFVVAAEFMGASEGLGYLLVDGQQLGKSDQILAAILVFAILGKLSDALIMAISKPFLRWQDNFQPGN